jgi:hypothetical protein
MLSRKGASRTLVSEVGFAPGGMRCVVPWAFFVPNLHKGYLARKFSGLDILTSVSQGSPTEVDHVFGKRTESLKTLRQGLVCTQVRAKHNSGNKLNVAEGASAGVEFLLSDGRGAADHSTVRNVVMFSA